MRKSIIYILLISLLGCQVENNKSTFNFDFELLEDGSPIGWETNDKSILIDTITVQNGRHSAILEYHGDYPSQKILLFPISDIYDGRKITLSGYIKTENITDGFAGLWMRIDPQVGLNNMYEQRVTGSTDWTKHEITLDMNPGKTTQILVGGILTGKGKMWLDNLMVTIDGEDIHKLTPLEIGKITEGKTYPSEKDKMFNNSSGLSFPQYDTQLIQNLELLGKLWGFLKYHHPKIANGSYNWDYELFRMLPDFIKVKNHSERDILLIKWITKYGKIPICKTCRETDANAISKPDLSWIEEYEMALDLKNKIREIYTNRYQGEQYYIQMSPAGNPLFKKENSYSNIPYSDAGFRLLTLYRYWNVIQYFFPYKHLCDKNWDNVLKEYIPLFISEMDELKYEQTIWQLISEINDSHAYLWTKTGHIKDWKGRLKAPFKVRFIENQLVVTQYYDSVSEERTGLKIGDVITHINDKSVNDIVDSFIPYYSMSNKAIGLRDISNDILRSNKSTLSIKYISAGQSKYEEIPLSEIDDLTRTNLLKPPSHKIIHNNIGYITVGSISDNDIFHIRRSFSDLKGIIIDIRSYPSAFVPFSLGSFFVTDRTPFVKYSTGNTNNPGEFTWGSSDYLIPNIEMAYNGVVVILVNEETLSLGEFTAMALKAGNNAIILGSTTAGTDGNVSSLKLPSGLRTSFSGLGVYFPDGTETQRIGITPDIWVEPTIQGIRDHKDEILEKAIEIIMKETASRNP